MMKKKQVIPLFIFSLPRAGSTLLQRILKTNDEVATKAEPWVLLPLLYAFKEEGLYAEYSHEVANFGVNDFLNNIPGADEFVNAKIKEIAEGLYQMSCKGEESYFLDKTPRYDLIADEIIEMFPEGKFIFLWRNPLSVVASLIETFGIPGHWNIHASEIDMYKGADLLIKAFQKHKEKVLMIKYEDLVENVVEVAASISNYLGLVYTEEMVHSFSNVELEGILGDPTGRKKYNTLTKETIDKWKSTLKNPLRKRWLKNYIKWLNKERLAVMGYDYDEILKDIDGIEFSLKYILSDIFKMPYGFFYRNFEINILTDKYKKIKRKEIVYGHR
jgi:hypothetical protein